jgi:hypothetical protein
LNTYTRAIKEISSKRKKTDDDNLEMSRLEFLGGLYWAEEIGIYMPAENIFRALMQAASINRAGKKIERGLIAHGSRYPLQFDGPSDPDELWGGGTSQFVDRRMVNIMGKRIARTRPIFPRWGFSFDCDISTDVLDVDEFTSIVNQAGSMIGLGDYRRFYGKFTATVTL